MLNNTSQTFDIVTMTTLYQPVPINMSIYTKTQDCIFSTTKYVKDLSIETHSIYMNILKFKKSSDDDQNLATIVNISKEVTLAAMYMDEAYTKLATFITTVNHNTMSVSANLVISSASRSKVHLDLAKAGIFNIIQPYDIDANMSKILNNGDIIRNMAQQAIMMAGPTAVLSGGLSSNSSYKLELLIVGYKRNLNIAEVFKNILPIAELM